VIKLKAGGHRSRRSIPRKGKDSSLYLVHMETTQFIMVFLSFAVKQRNFTDANTWIRTSKECAFILLELTSTQLSMEPSSSSEAVSCRTTQKVPRQFMEPKGSWQCSEHNRQY
jgi:hypothetical protein